MNKTSKFSATQLTVLVILRILIGWHFLYEGISKVINPGWTSAGFLKESKWILSGFAKWVISNDGVLQVVDFLNTWGLIAIGLGLILGLFSRAAAISGVLLLLLYYSITPPLTGLSYSVPFEGNYLIVSKTLIEAVALLVLTVFPTSSVLGLDVLIFRQKNKKNK